MVWKTEWFTNVLKWVDSDKNTFIIVLDKNIVYVIIKSKIYFKPYSNHNEKKDPASPRHANRVKSPVNTLICYWLNLNVVRSLAGSTHHLP